MEEEWDKIEVEEIEDLIKKVEEFYAERGNPKLNVIWLADLFLKRLKNDLDYYINCEGQKGYGKSNLMLLLSLMQSRYAGVYKRKSDGKHFKVLPRVKPLDVEKFERISVGFSFNKNMSFLDNVKDIEKKYHSLDKYQSFVIDEGSKNLHKHRWMDALQFKLVQLSDTERWQNKTFFICFPNFIELNSAFRNNRIMMRIYVYHRDVKKHYASAILSLKDINRYIADPWHTDWNAKLFEDILKRTPSSLRTSYHVLKAEKKLKGYAGTFEFPELKVIAPKIWSIYMKYKIENATKEAEVVEETEGVRILRWKVASKNLVDWVRLKFPKMTYPELAEIMGIANITLIGLRTLKKPDKIILRQVDKIVREN